MGVVCAQGRAARVGAVGLQTVSGCQLDVCCALRGDLAAIACLHAAGVAPAFLMQGEVAIDQACTNFTKFGFSHSVLPAGPPAPPAAYLPPS